MNIYIQDQVYELLAEFDAGLTFKNSSIIKAETITPDSWAVRILMNSNSHNGRYFVLYSEDFLSSITLVTSCIEEWHGAKLKKFIRPLNSKPTDEWEEWAAGSDGGCVVLAEVEPPIGEEFWGSPDVRVEYSEKAGQLVDPTKPFIDEWKKKTHNS